MAGNRYRLDDHRIGRLAAGFIHALWVNFTVRLPLMTTGTHTVRPKTLTGS